MFQQKPTPLPNIHDRAQFQPVELLVQRGAQREFRLRIRVIDPIG
jgi:hypothetical protein